MAGVGGSGGVNGEANELNDYAAKTHELQTIIEKQVKIADLFPVCIWWTLFKTLFPCQTSELSQWQRRVSDLNNKISELEENMSRVQKEHCKAQDQCAKLQRDLRENVAQKEDQVSE